MGCRSCGGAADPTSVFEIPPQPSAPRPVAPQTIQGQAPPPEPVADGDTDPQPARQRRSRKSGD